MNNFLFVVVLYEMTMSRSLTMCSLARSRNRFPQLGIHLLVIDNTPGVKPESSMIDDETEYIAFGENRGLAKAYQAAFLVAKARSFRFLVLFDQDSDVSAEFIDALDEVGDHGASSVAIWCPDVRCGERPISPYSFKPFGWPNFHHGSKSERLYGINSFSAVDVRFIEAVGGFDEYYWLDCLDTWLYEQAHRNRWTVRRLNATVKHNLSLVSGEITLSRLQNIAFYESSFVLEFGSGGRISGTLLRLLVRGIKHARSVGGIRSFSQYLLAIAAGARAGLRRRSGKGA